MESIKFLDYDPRLDSCKKKSLIINKISTAIQQNEDNNIEVPTIPRSKKMKNKRTPSNYKTDMFAGENASVGFHKALNE